MGFPTFEIPDWLPPITKDIIELEHKISLLKWWQIKQRLELKSKLRNMRETAFFIGMETALKHLEEMGLIKVVK